MSSSTSSAKTAPLSGTSSHLELGEPSLLKQPKSVWAVFFASIIAFMGLGLVDPILPAISASLNATPSQVTLLFTSYNAVMAVAMLITGAISSRIGIKWTLLAGIVVIAVFSALGGMAGDVWTIIGLRGGWGLGNALFVATALSAIVTLSSSGTGKAVILYEAAVGLGISVGPLLGGWLGAISWRGPFLGVASLMVIAFIGLILLMPKENKGEVTRSRTSILAPFRAMKHRSLVVLGLTACFYNFGFFTLMAYAPFVMGLDEHGLGYVFLAWGILLAITSVGTAPKLQEKFGTLKSMCAMLFLFSLVLLAMGIWTNSPWVIIAAVIFAGALLGNNNTLITTAVMNAAPVERSTASAAYSFLRFLGGAVAPFLAGKLAEWYNPHVPFIVGAGFVMLAVVFIALNRKHVQHVDQVESAH
ncbi:MFS transporter [Paenibacillus macerans]|uniref:MFS transporter n=2 Tax=Paenibacillus macerans TaxID=44252 RepID=A0A6N8EYH7_PAEMA|nr:MFS transporter [Paenibacillus macerans]MEC0328424.1 MFS transporter [Paenibacillus macerans]MUG23381.1 MFS transporter [Paenibacillus macerans]UMV45892.1 MFS transporter [Paenibacillus macerans]